MRFKSENKFLEFLKLTVLTIGGAILMWGLLYLTIPGVKDNTDQIFKWGEYKIVEELPDETPEDETPTEDPTEDETPVEDETNTPTPTATYKFGNELISITVC